MRRSLCATIVAALALCPLRPAVGQARVVVAGGLAAPMSDLSDVADFGYHIGAGLDVRGLLPPLGLRIEGALSGFGRKTIDEEVRVLDLTANALVDIGTQTNSPYLIGGLGLYNSKFGDADSESAIGVNLGGGLRFPIGRLDTFFEARYHAMLGERAAGANLQFLPITFGIVF
jgi:hypothetical protein